MRLSDAHSTARCITAVLIGLTLLAACGTNTPPALVDVTPASLTNPFGNTALIRPSPLPGETPTNVRQAGPLRWPDCTPQVATPVAFPTIFAPDFPFPPDLKLFKSITLNNDPNYKRTQVVGYTPLSLRSAIFFILDEWPQTGYVLGRGDSESNEAESQFSGKGWTGSVWVRELMNCPGVTEWVVIVSKH